MCVCGGGGGGGGGGQLTLRTKVSKGAKFINSGIKLMAEKINLLYINRDGLSERETERHYKEREGDRDKLEAD